MLHEELRNARETAGLSQAELAARVGIPRNQIVRAEKGENITLDTLRKIVVHLPIKELSLLDAVKLTTDVLPIHDKIYVGAMEMVAATLQTLAAALEHAQDTWASLQTAQRQETPDEKAQRGAEVDPTLLFQRIERSLKTLEHPRKSA